MQLRHNQDNIQNKRLYKRCIRLPPNLKIPLRNGTESILIYLSSSENLMETFKSVKDITVWIKRQFL